MTAVGVLNPNSQLKDWNKAGISLPEFPLPLEIKIRNLETVIRADENIRTYNYMVGNLDGAKFQALKIGAERAELRRLKLGL